MKSASSTSARPHSWWRLLLLSAPHTRWRRAGSPAGFLCWFSDNASATLMPDRVVSP